MVEVAGQSLGTFSKLAGWICSSNPWRHFCLLKWQDDFCKSADVQVNTRGEVSSWRHLANWRGGFAQILGAIFVQVSDRVTRVADALAPFSKLAGWIAHQILGAIFVPS